MLRPITRETQKRHQIWMPYLAHQTHFCLHTTYAKWAGFIGNLANTDRDRKAPGKEVNLKFNFTLFPILFKPLHCSKDIMIKLCLIHMTKAPLPKQIGRAEVISGIVQEKVCNRTCWWEKSSSCNATLGTQPWPKEFWPCMHHYKSFQVIFAPWTLLYLEGCQWDCIGNSTTVPCR